MTATAPLVLEPHVTRPSAPSLTGLSTGLSTAVSTAVSTGPGRRAGAWPWRRQLEGAALALGGVAAAWLLARQLRSVDLATLVTQTQGRWALLAVVLIGGSFLGAAWNLMGFSAVRLSLVPTVLVQVAGGFVKVVSPAAVGCALVNARYLRRSGASRAETVTSIGAAQLVQFLVTVAFLGGLAAMPGSPATAIHLDGTVVAAVTGAVLALAAVLLGLRHRPRIARALAHVRGELANLAGHALRSPGRVALGVLGSVVLVLSFALGLASSVRAFGGSVDLLTLTVVFLAGSAAGSLIPSPGGLGTVEAALVTGLVATGQRAEVAVPAVLFFRLVSVWVPVPLGWIAVHVLRRRALL